MERLSQSPFVTLCVLWAFNPSLVRDTQDPLTPPGSGTQRPTSRIQRTQVLLSLTIFRASIVWENSATQYTAAATSRGWGGGLCVRLNDFTAVSDTHHNAARTQRTTKAFVKVALSMCVRPEKERSSTGEKYRNTWKASTVGYSIALLCVESWWRLRGHAVLPHDIHTDLREAVGISIKPFQFSLSTHNTCMQQLAGCSVHNCINSWRCGTQCHLWVAYLKYISDRRGSTTLHSYTVSV